jgi:hypothetical protein
MATAYATGTKMAREGKSLAGYNVTGSNGTCYDSVPEDNQVMNFNIMEHYRHLSQDLASQSHVSSAYGHRGSKGQLREEILLTTLQGMAHDFVKLCKGEICDATGRRSVEFDIIVSYLSSAIRLFSTPTHHVIPVENVLVVLEVKSMLKKDEVTTFNTNLAHLNTFDRYYVPTILYKEHGVMAGTHEYASFIDHPTKPTETLRGVSPIWGGIFAFDAPAPETIRTWLTEVETETNFFFICVLGKFFAYRARAPRQWYIAARGEDTFGLFAGAFLDLINSDEREVHVKADSHRYIDMAARALQR